MNSEIKLNKNMNKLINGTVIYFIGTFLSKCLSIIMLPFITSYISSADYGYYDLVITLVGLFMPLFTIQSIEAIFRFLFDADDIRKKELLTNVWLIIFVGILAFLGILVIYNTFISQIQYLGWFILYFIITIIITMYQRVARSYNKSLEFAISGIINAILLASLQIILIFILKIGIESLYLSYIISTFITCLYLEKKTRALMDFTVKLISVKCIKEVVKFGLPLVPNNISWWAASSLNKVIIIYYLGTSANGNFAVANRFTYILSTLASVFQMSWQETAIITYKDTDRDTFNSGVFNTYYQGLIYMSFIAILIIKPIVPIFFGEEYQEILKYMPIMFYGTSMSCVSLFYGAGYISSKKTKGAFWTTIIGALINVVICIAFINTIGLFAPAISTFVAYLCIWIIRHSTMKAYFEIKLQWITIIKTILMGVIITVVYYYGNYYVSIVALIVVVGYFCYINRSMFDIVLKKIFIKR